MGRNTPDVVDKVSIAPEVLCSKSRGEPDEHLVTPDVNSLWDETLLM